MEDFRHPVSAAKTGGNPGDEQDSLIYTRWFSGDRCRLSLVGELKNETADGFYSEVYRLFESGVTDMVLDFRGLKYIDSTGLQSIVRIYKYARSKSGLKFILLVMESELLDVLKICRFDIFIDITSDPAIIEGDWQQG